MDSERPAEVRIASLRTLGWIGIEESFEALHRAAADRIRQVRLAAFVALVGMTLNPAVDGGLESPEAL